MCQHSSMSRKKDKQIKEVADPSSHHTTPPPQPELSASGAIPVAPTGAFVDMAPRLQGERGMEVDIEEDEEEEEEEEVMPASKYPALVESPFVTGVIETFPIGNNLREAWEAEWKIVGAMVELTKI